jgi:uncharacterized membrane protein
VMVLAPICWEGGGLWLWIVVPEPVKQRQRQQQPIDLVRVRQRGVEARVWILVSGVKVMRKREG